MHRRVLTPFKSRDGIIPGTSLPHNMHTRTDLNYWLGLREYWVLVCSKTTDSYQKLWSLTEWNACRSCCRPWN